MPVCATQGRATQPGMILFESTSRRIAMESVGAWGHAEERLAKSVKIGTRRLAEFATAMAARSLKPSHSATVP
jgi:hypothetical protein